MRVLKCEQTQLWTLAYSPDGRTLAAAGSATGSRRGALVTLWDLATGEPSRTLTSRFVADAFRIFTTVAFSPDGRWLAAGDGSINAHPGEVIVWEAATGQKVHTFPSKGEFVWSVAFSPDGLLLASGDSTGIVTLWDMATGIAQRKLFRDHVRDWYRPPRHGWLHAHYLAFSPDGQLLAVALNATEQAVNKRGVGYSKHSGEVRLLRLPSGRPRACLPRKPGGYSQVAFSPDGTILATGSHRGPVTLWDAASAQPLRTLGGKNADTAQIAFSPDGRILGGTRWDGVVAFWDVATGREMARFQWEEKLTQGIAFAPDGMTVAAASMSGHIFIWDVDAP
jgi:WD40 repeat protein